MEAVAAFNQQRHLAIREIRLMTIHEFIWPEVTDRTYRPARRLARRGGRGVLREAVGAKGEIGRRESYVLGQTATGRYLFCVVIAFPDGKGYPVTARDMTAKEKRRYRKWKSR